MFYDYIISSVVLCVQLMLSCHKSHALLLDREVVDDKICCLYCARRFFSFGLFNFDVYISYYVQATESSRFTQDDDEDEDYKNFYSGEYLEGEDGELTWFNAGVRVGVGIGLGICLGVGIGVGVLVRTYQATSRRFRRR